MTPPDQQQPSIDALSNLLDLKGLDASGFIDVINVLGKIQKRDAAKEAREEEEKKGTSGSGASGRNANSLTAYAFITDDKEQGNLAKY